MISMNTNVLSYLIAAAKEKSISRAAEKCFISQPALSRYLSQIERELGTKLFFRCGNGLQLTDAGKIYINNAQAILLKERQLTEALSSISSDFHIQMAVSPLFPGAVLDHLIAELYNNFPAYELTVTEAYTDQAKEQLLSGTSDLILYADLPLQETSEQRKLLYEDELVLVIHHDHPDTKALIERGISSQLLQNYNWIGVPNTPPFISLEKNMFDAYEFHPRTLFRPLTNSDPMLSNGHCATLLPRSRLTAHPENITFLPLKSPSSFSWFMEIREQSMLPSPLRFIYETFISNQYT